VKNWVKELRKMLGQDICLCIAGNKIDLEKNRHVSVEEAEEYAKSVGARHLHTSAKLNKGIDELFLNLTKNMLESAAQLQSDSSSAQGRSNTRSTATRKGLVIVSDEEAKSDSIQKSGCC